MNWWHRFWRHNTKASVMKLGSWRDGMTIFSYRCITCDIEWRWEIR